jgi:hypothetical protein
VQESTNFMNICLFVKLKLDKRKGEEGFSSILRQPASDFYS